MLDKHFLFNAIENFTFCTYIFRIENSTNYNAKTFIFFSKKHSIDLFFQLKSNYGNIIVVMPPSFNSKMKLFRTKKGQVK